MLSVGRKIPCALKSYLYNAKGELIGRPNLKVVFGPGNSFFAWDDHSVRWHKIPERMESVVQGWMTTTGWRHGLPKIVALGTDDLYFILTEENVASYWVPPHHAKTRRAMMRWEQDKYHNLSVRVVKPYLS